MKVKEIEIVGFKSFVDRTKLRFDQGVTCIVGPNGCGKSNVVDAIKWVMGEQSPSRLRGKAMDDIIFSGSEGRGPHGFAEVTLTFDNADGLAPPEYAEYAEISVSRRLDRQGRSDYFINRTPVRLLDVTNLFLGTGVGRRAYSIIEQGRIGFIVSSKPEDRRQMIEEAAGVTKFKVRKRAAERKMEHTRQNLLRVSDIISELEKDLASLKRQAQKAERYKQYRSEARDLELYVATHKYLRLHSELKVVQRTLTDANDNALKMRTDLSVRETEVETKRADLRLISQQVERSQSIAYELDNRVRHLEALIEQAEQHAASATDRESIAQRDLDETQAQKRDALVEAEELTQKLALLEASEKEASDALNAALTEFERRRQAANEAESSVKNAQKRVSETETAIARTEALLLSFDQRRLEMNERVQKLYDEEGVLKTTIVETRQRHQETRVRIDALQGGKAEHAALKDEIGGALESLTERLSVDEAEVERLRESLANKKSRLRSLTEILERYEGSGSGVRALFTDYAPSEGVRAEKGIRGTVGDLIDCDAEHHRVLAAALGETLQTVVVENEASALNAIEYLKSNDRGRARFLIVSAQSQAVPSNAMPSTVSRLLDVIRCADRDRVWVERLLQDVAVAYSLSMRSTADATVIAVASSHAMDNSFLKTGNSLAVRAMNRPRI
ncbi:MAG: AAA family ATPase [Polyangiales bacterium]